MCQLAFPQLPFQRPRIHETSSKGSEQFWNHFKRGSLQIGPSLRYRSAVFTHQVANVRCANFTVWPLSNCKLPYNYKTERVNLIDNFCSMFSGSILNYLIIYNRRQVDVYLHNLVYLDSLQLSFRRLELCLINA